MRKLAGCIGIVAALALATGAWAAQVGVDNDYCGESVGAIANYDMTGPPPSGWPIEPCAGVPLTGTVSATLVQGWLANPLANHGLALIPPSTSYYLNTMFPSTDVNWKDTVDMTLWFSDGTNATIEMNKAAMIKFEDQEFNLHGDGDPLTGAGNWLTPLQDGPHPVLYEWDVSDYNGKTLMAGLDPEISATVNWTECGRIAHLYAIQDSWDQETVTYESLVQPPPPAPPHTGEMVGVDDTFWGESDGRIQIVGSVGGFIQGNMTREVVQGWLGGTNNGIALIAPAPIYYGNTMMPSVATGWKERILTFQTVESGVVSLTITESALIKADDPTFNLGGVNIPVDGFLSPQNGLHPLLYQWDLSAYEGETLVDTGPNEFPTMSFDYNWTEDPPLYGYDVYAVGAAWDDDTVTYESLLSGGCMPGDVTCDGFVGGDDLDIILGNWGQTLSGGWAVGDLNGDLFIGGDDLDEVLAHWGDGTPPAGGTPVPEPATLGLIGLGALAMMRRKR